MFKSGAGNRDCGPDGSPVDTAGWQYAVASGILGWVLDAFDFFVVIFLVDSLATHFQVEKSAIVWTISIALAMRPVGAFFFGALADRFGRRIPLIICVLYFSTVTLVSAFAPNYAVFAVLRALYGIGMGGYWGTGASLAMESAPQQRRGFLSGLMQSGYPVGYLLAAVAIKAILPRYGWRSMFGVGLPVALLISLVALRAPESVAWRENRVGSVGSILLVLWRHRGGFAYLLLLMTVMSCFSHGTQDLYPDFLRSAHGLTRDTVSNIAILYNTCAIASALLFGQISERLGRRRGIMLALCVSLTALGPWAFGTSLAVLILGACVMQAGVQGAFGVIPAHLNELSPDAARSLFPGLAYQLGVLVASPAVSVEYALRNRLGYPWALTIFEGTVILCLLFIFQFGPERQGRSFRASHVGE
ncbi:Major facilitator superfamily (MFS) transporter [Candidatus Sulfotelmatobacter kueseliae]|uniref:Major facilitator superfamily (MFS) transporter n=1 Tax=Candidatus Sulfotelmatobacter kueseliae TaxID=2042962 RepID=A0A2U3K3M2_9BACT|nr:Major facilitator superfamily (MFS) transporter [Candidatus Sulfotelmatobacter kueseliae]